MAAVVVRRVLRAPVESMAVAAGLVAVLASLAVAALADGVAERGDLTRVDPAVRVAAVSLRDPVLTAAAQTATFVGSEPSIATMSVLLVAWLVLRRRAWSAALLVGSATAVAAATTLVLKHLLDRPRPPASAVLGALDTTYSFPSGHTVSSTVFFGLLAGLLLCRVSSWRARAGVTAAWAAASAAVGLSRLYLGYHWLTDVLAGWSTGVAILALTAALAVLLRRPAQRPR